MSSHMVIQLQLVHLLVAHRTPGGGCLALVLLQLWQVGELQVATGAPKVLIDHVCFQISHISKYLTAHRARSLGLSFILE